MFFLDYTIILLIPGLIFSAFAQYKVSTTFAKYNKVRIENGLTGNDASRRLLALHGLNLPIKSVSGNLTDHYDPRNKSISLSQNVANQATVAAVGVAAHETGHAIQDDEHYFPLTLRNLIYPACGFASKAAWPLFFIGLIFGSNALGGTLMNIGILLYVVVIFFYLITLPVEFNASHRALVMLHEDGMVSPEEEKAVKKVLTAAAMTYLASALMAILQLIRLLALRDRR